MKRKILVVEDNDMNRDMVSRYLDTLGFGIVQATDGLQALERARAERPDLILMDMSLPEMDGWEATRHLKADTITQDIPVIALTAHAMLGDREETLEAGCDEYETKPIDFRRLLTKIEALLHKEAAV
jgi:two-component system cell cycle response regulator DivK